MVHRRNCRSWDTKPVLSVDVENFARWHSQRRQRRLFVKSTGAVDQDLIETVKAAGTFFCQRDTRQKIDNPVVVIAWRFGRDANGDATVKQPRFGKTKSRKDRMVLNSPHFR